MRKRAPLLVACYMRLVSLLPRTCRERFGNDMTAVLMRMIEDERPRGRFARLRWDLAVLVRGLVAVAGLWIDRLRAPRLPLALPSSGKPSGLGPDIRFVARSLRAAPWYTLTIIGVVAVPVTMAATTFAIVDGVLFRPLPYPDAGALVMLRPNFNGPARVTDPALPQGASEVDLRHWRAAVPDVPLTAYRAQPWGGLGPDINENSAGVAMVEQGFFDVLGVRPMIGGFAADDFTTVATLRPVIATWDVWQGRFGGEAILGREIVADRASGSGVRIVGVMPRGFTFPSALAEVSFLTPYVSTPESRNNPQRRIFTEVVARLPEGVSRADVEQRLLVAAAAVAAEFPSPGQRPRGWSDVNWRRQGPYDTFEAAPLSDSLSRRHETFFKAVFGAVTLLLLLAAINISSLMAARALDRRPEMDVRRSLGAPAAAIARLWSLEALGLVMAGGLFAAAATPAFLEIMTRLLPDEVVLLKPPHFDWRVGGFIAMTLLTLAMIIAIAPIRRSLGAIASRSVSSRVRTPGRFLIISGQVGVAVVLTVLGSMLVGSLLVVYAERPKLNTDDVVTLDVMFSGPGATMDVSPERNARELAIRTDLMRIPGVLAAGTSAAQVLRGGGALSWFAAPPGRSLPRNIDTWAISEGFFSVVRPEILTGRLPTDDELRSAAPVIAVSESVARQYWPDTAAVGQTLTDASKVTFTIVGVVRDIRWTALDVESPVIYAPYGTTSRAPWITVFLRTDGSTGRVTADALAAIARIDPLVRPTRTGTLDELFRESVSLRRFQSWLFGSFAAASLVVVGAGILGLLAMTTARRTKEVGIRCALGATPRRVLSLVLLEQLVPVLAGVVAGALVAALAVRPLQSYLYRITAADPTVWLTAIALVLTMAAIGAWVPAMRASRTDPLRALRQE